MLFPREDKIPNIYLASLEEAIRKERADELTFIKYLIQYQKHPWQQCVLSKRPAMICTEAQ